VRAGAHGGMKMISFKEWCNEQPFIEYIMESTFGDTWDNIGIDAIIRMDGKIRPIQYRIRNTSHFQDVTIRCYGNQRTEDRSYKIINVPYFIYITPDWWVILETKFYNEIPHGDPIENNDGSSFYKYHLNALRPYIYKSDGMKIFTKKKNNMGDLF